jgi:uncharacterized protein YndB with AHSA1/START domain
MSQTVKLDVFYPYPPERVWQVLTDRRALAAWMMENDFEPKLGHKFRFYSHSLFGFKNCIQCEVVELEAPTRLAYTWQESVTAEPSLVVWTLTTVTGGTQLRLKHYQYSYATAVGSCDRPATTVYSRQDTGLFFSDLLPSAVGSAVAPPGSNLYGDPFYTSGLTLQRSSPNEVASEFFQFGIVEWDYFLNQTLPDLLAQS